MMNNEINLLYSKKQLRKYKLTTQVRVLRFGALGFLFLVTLLSITFFLMVVASPLSSLKQQENAQNQLIAQSQDKVNEQTLLTIRMNDISTIVEKRSQYDQILTLLIAKLPPGASVKEFSAEKKQAVITVRALSTKDLEEYISQLTRLVADNTTFSRVFLDSLSLELGKDDQITNFKARLVLSLL